MKDERAGVVTSDSTVRMTTSIFRAAYKPRVENITATVMADSPDVLVELWAHGGLVVGQYIATGEAATQLLKRVEPNARRESIL